MRLLFLLLLFILFSCGGNLQKEEPISSSGDADSTLVKISGVWVDRSDPAHEWVISASSIADLYSGDTVSIKAAEAWTGFSVSGGMPFPSGGVIRIEDEPGNFFEFELIKVDSLYLELVMYGSEQLFSFIRKQNMPNSCDCGKIPVDVMVQQELMIRDQPDGEIIGKIEGGSYFWNITASEKEWLRVELPDGRKGWIRGKEFTIDLKKEKEILLKERADDNSPNAGFAIANNCITSCCNGWLGVEGETKAGKGVVGWWKP